MKEKEESEESNFSYLLLSYLCYLNLQGVTKKKPHLLNRGYKSETSFAKKTANLHLYLDFLQKMGGFFL